MRYRPLGASGIAVSTVSLAIEDNPGFRPSEWTALGYAALENGINSFEILGRDPAILEGMSEAFGSVSRRLLYIGLRLGNTEGRRDFSAPTITKAAQAMITRTGVEYLDFVMLDDPTSEELPPEALKALKELKREGKVNQLGVCGKDDAIEAYILTEAFDLLCSPYNMQSGWRERHRMRLAQDRDMAVIGYDYFPDGLANRGVGPIEPHKGGGWLARKPVATPIVIDPYAFLDDTANWTAEEICLAYALTEPALASVQVRVTNAEALGQLAEVPDRDLPNGLGSRVEMARFGATPPQAAAKG